MTLVDSAAHDVALLANAIGTADISGAAAVPAEGQYILKVQSDGQWNVSITQPKATYSPPPATQTFSGHASQATALFSLKAGAARFHSVSSNGADNFIAILLDQNGNDVELVANEVGASDSSTVANIPSNGVYLLNVEFEGDWTITVQQ